MGMEPQKSMLLLLAADRMMHAVITGLFFGSVCSETRPGELT